MKTVFVLILIANYSYLVHTHFKTSEKMINQFLGGSDPAHLITPLGKKKKSANNIVEKQLENG